ncbi:MAG: rod shape-determining protein MreC [Gammaproteobacteria bacterium RIFCSPHIGHO2_12_FULL_40_19]|nr:MAG: rod shape-determining protein MreC [Gammaproteobacteria bacterium RIFCSPHIGHO2_12_FULL_40_19]
MEIPCSGGITDVGVGFIKRLFYRGSGPGLRALIFLVLSIALITVDQRSAAFHNFRMRFSSTVAYPFELIVDSPMRFVHWLNASVTSQRHLLHENEELRVREILLQSRLQKLLSLEEENAHLRQLLQSTAEISGRVEVARLLAVALDPNLQQVVLNKGTNDQVYQGQPVLDAFGVMGQVIGVGPLTSKILLITDKLSAVPVEDYRNGVRAIAVGLGASGQLALMNVPDENDIQSGDLFVTSGLGLCYPVGYPVGMVSKIQHVNDSGAEKILLMPMAHLDQTEQVLLAWPNKTKLTQAVQQQLQETFLTNKQQKVVTKS